MRIKRLLAAVTLGVVLLGNVPLSAQSTDQQASGLSITPPRSELTLKPGEANKIDISLNNVTAGKIVARPVINDFVSDNETGSPRIITDAKSNNPASVKSFISGLDEVTLEKGEKRTTTVLVQAPSNAAPGAYYGIINYQAIPASQANNPQPGQVALTASLGMLVLIQVPGNITHNLQLQNVIVYSGKKKGNFFTSAPTQLGVEVKSLGNGFEKPFGHVVVKNMSGKEVESYEINSGNPRANVLPGSTRVFKNDIKNAKSPGKYKAIVSLSYDNGSSVLASEKTFWYVPGWLIAVILIGIVVLVGALYIVYRKKFSNKGGHAKVRKA